MRKEKANGRCNNPKKVDGIGADKCGLGKGDFIDLCCMRRGKIFIRTVGTESMLLQFARKPQDDRQDSWDDTIAELFMDSVSCCRSSTVNLIKITSI
jgi:hypothetical protein